MAKQTLKSTGTMTLRGKEVPYITYTTNEGDSVYGLWLSNRSQTTVGAIQEANHIKTNELKKGLVLKIPLVI